MSSRPPVSRLVRLAGALPVPNDYFSGLRAPATVRADNILLFYRATYSDLQQRALENRSHNRFVLLVPLAAGAGVNLDRAEFALRPGSALLIFPYQFHFFVNPEQERLDWVVLTFESEFPVALESLRNRPVTLEPDAFRRLESLLRAYGENRAGGESEVRLTAEILLQKLTRAPGADTVAAQPDGAELRTGEWLAFINRRLHDGGPGAYKIAALAAGLGVSERLLRLRFGESFGVSLGAYIADFRLNLAAGLLSRSTLSLGDVAGRCGYASQAAFSRAFLASFGVTPRDYRGRHGAVGG